MPRKKQKSKLYEFVCLRQQATKAAIAKILVFNLCEQSPTEQDAETGKQKKRHHFIAQPAAGLQIKYQKANLFTCRV
jgi:hypothetical protein